MNDLDLGIITDSISPAAGGLFESVRLPANKLVQRGPRVTVYGIWDSQSDAARTEWQGPALEVGKLAGPNSLRVSPGLLRKLLAADHDLLHLHGIWQFPSYATDRWRRARGRPTVISPRGMLDPWALRRSPLKKRIARSLYEDRNLAGAAVLHALNVAEAAAIRAYGLQNPIAVIPNGVDLPDLSVERPRPQYMKNDDRRVLLFLGRLHVKKGIRQLIHAWELLHRRSPAVGRDWRLIVAGWDDAGHQRTLIEAIQALDLHDHVQLVGPLHGETKAAALQHASGFILPSLSEGMPMSVLEGWAFRLPVFMTAACNLPHAFDAQAAIEIDTDPIAMATVLTAGLADTDRLRCVAQAGHLLVGQSYTWDRIVSDMEDLYAWVLNHGERPAFVDAT
jgi:glycosyltransferase involved in cell wall biosynthesis